MTAPESGDETRTVTILDRKIQVHELTEAQKLLMSREVRNILRTDLPIEKRVAAVGSTFDIVEALVVNEDDVAFIEQKIMERKLDIPDLKPLLAAFNQKPEAKPRARRGRPPKRAQ